MALPRRNPLVLSALLAACALASCGSAPRLPPSFETAGLRVDVAPAKRVKPTKKKPGHYIEVTVKIWNNHEGRISFEADQVRLNYGSDEVAPVEVRDSRLEVPSKQPKEFKWKFETPEHLQGGVYDVAIHNINKGDAPLGESARFQIEVP